MPSFPKGENCCLALPYKRLAFIYFGRVRILEHTNQIDQSLCWIGGNPHDAHRNKERVSGMLEIADLNRYVAHTRDQPTTI
jgi:hypothetical protein